VEFELRDTFFSFGENGFSALRIAMLAYEPVVFGAKFLFQLFASAAPFIKDRSDRDENDNNSDENQSQGL
jgi:hypothetical protein